MNKKSFVRYFALISTFLLFFSLLTPGFSHAEGNQIIKKLDREENALAKINNQLLEKFTEEKHVSFLVQFKEKVDPEKVAQQAEKQSKQGNLSDSQEKFLKRSTIVSELRTVALQEQQQVLSYLNQAAEEGSVTSIRSFFIVNMMEVTATKEIAEKIASFSEVEKLIVNETRTLELPTTSELAPMENTNIEWNVERVGAPEVWENGMDGSGVVVATIDSGVQWDHPALKEQYRGYNVESGEVDHNFNWFDATTGEMGAESEPYDDVGHGTHVTGTIVGGEPDGTNKVGVAPGAEWISAKAFDSAGNSTDGSLLAAGQWIVAPTDANGNSNVSMAPDIVNNSWSGGSGIDEWYREMINIWIQMEILPVFSAGNKGLLNPGGPGSIANPANLPEAFAVGATDTDDFLANFSLRGPSPYDVDIKPEVVAPGVDIRSAGPDGDYYVNNGTSMAAPAVSGVAVLLKSTRQDLTVAEMKDILMHTTTPLTDDEYPTSPNNGYGYGLVNAARAVDFVMDGYGTLVGNLTDGASGMPLSGTVTLIESERSVKSRSDDGQYTLIHGEGEFTARAEAYGYEPMEQVVTITVDETLTADFALEELPTGTVHGVVTNGITGEVIPEATILLVEDSNIVPVVTNDAGKYSITAYEGTYTLRVLAADYHRQDIEVTIEEGEAELTISLEPFYTYPGGEIGYDDGTAENALSFSYGGNAYAVKMQLPEGKKSAVVTEGIYKFWDESFPDPGSTDFEVEVWDTSGVNGFPGKRIAGPFEADAVRNKEEWTVVDLRKHNIIVHDDFYMVYRQTGDYPDVPGLASDESGTFSYQNYQYNKSDGSWIQTIPYWGNLMIRASIAFEVETPVITNPVNGFVTSVSEVMVEGTASPATELQLLKNGDEMATALIGEDGQFKLPVTLDEGENKLLARSMLDGQITSESEFVTVLLDSVSPEIVITSPNDGEIENDQTVVVKGSVSDTSGVDFVTVNGETVELHGAHFAKSVSLVEGTNEIEVLAQDIVGNIATETLSIELDSSLKRITRLYGDTRYETAIEISQDGWDSAETVILARGDDYADALVAVPLAYQLHAPILLTNSRQLSEGVIAEIERLGAREVIVLGGDGAITGAVDAKLASKELDIRRIAGETRFETAALIAEEFVQGNTETVAIANGMNFPDAMSIASFAAQQGMPILLTKSNQLPEATSRVLEEFDVQGTVVIGGTAVVEDGLLQELPEAVRLAGKDRYETNMAVVGELGLAKTDIFIATGKDYADALTGSVLAANASSGILLVGEQVNASLSSYIQEQRVNDVVILGGNAAVSQTVQELLYELMQ